MISKIAVAACMLALAGCASSPYVWTREGATESSIAADKASCQQASNQSMGTFESSNRGQVGPGVDAAMRRSDQSMSCMRARGYELVPASQR